MLNNFLSNEELEFFVEKIRQQKDRFSAEELDILLEMEQECFAGLAQHLSTLRGKKVYVEGGQLEQELEGVPEEFYAVEGYYEGEIAGSSILLLGGDDAEALKNCLQPQLPANGGEIEKMLEDLLIILNRRLSLLIGHGLEFSVLKSRKWTSKEDFVKKIEFHGKSLCFAFQLSLDEQKCRITIFHISPYQTLAGILNLRRNENHFPEEASKKSELQPQKTQIKKLQFSPLKKSGGTAAAKDLDFLGDVPLEISVLLGKTTISVREHLSLHKGGIIKLKKTVEEPVEVFANGRQVANAQVVVLEDNLGVRISSVTDIHNKQNK